MSREKKFTPGPWEWNGAAGVTNGKFEYPDNKDLVRVCDVWNNRGGMDHSEEILKANANLIAAAPTMLNELEIRCAACRRMTDPPPEQCDNCSTNSAIKKAYGETE